MKRKEHLLILFENGIGDCFMTFPAVRALFSLFENISLLADKAYHQLYSEFEFSKVFDKSSLNLFDTSGKQLIDTDFRSSNIDFKTDILISFVTDSNIEIESIINKINPIFKIGFFNSIFDKIISYLQNENIFDVYFKIANYFDKNLCITNFCNPILSPPNYRNTKYITLKNNFKIICIHSDTKADKEWETKKLNQLIKKLLNNIYNIFIIVIGNPRDISIDYPNLLILSNKIHFEVHWELLNNADYFIGIDSCFMHLSDINQIPGVALFGPTNENKWGFRFNKNSKIVKAKNNKTKLISVTEVFKTFISIYSMEPKKLPI